MSSSIRFHQKSRRGCNSCKIRRVKCDEGKPLCAGCIRRGDECLYPSNAAPRRQANSPAQPSPSAQEDSNATQPMSSFQQLSEGPHYSAKHLLDLRLMHHYSVFTTEFFAKSFPEQAVSVGLKVQIPRLALEHEFLMDAVLFVSMIHLGCTDPVSLESLPVYLYRDQALRALRRAVADISPQTFDAVRSASVLLATVSFATDRITRQSGLWIATWLTLVVGQRNFRVRTLSLPPSTSAHIHDYMQSPGNLYGSFEDLSRSGVIAVDIQRALSREDSDNTWADRETLHKAATELGRLIARLNHPYEEAWLEKKIKAWGFDVVPPEFVELVRQERPHALVILAYYLALFKLLPDTWVYQDIASHDIGHISSSIHPTWKAYISVPIMALQMDDRTALAQAFLTCLPADGEGGGPEPTEEHGM